MKRNIALLLIFILIFAMLCGCNNTASEISSHENINSKENYREHQELTANEAPFDSNKMMRFSIPEVGLENVFIRDISKEEKLSSDSYGRAYLFGDDRYGGGAFVADHYLAIVIDGNIFIKDLSIGLESGFAYSGVLDLCDVDGDNDSEIILQETVSITGGCGGFHSRIFDFKDGNIIEMFTSDNGYHFNYDTGYSIEILKDRKFKIKNKFTGYSEEFIDCRSGRDDKYSIYWWYDHETGEPKDISLCVDSFYEFKPIDIDNDGIYEISCRQYVSLIGHSDGLGDAKTILKYNNDSKQFDIIRTEFECYN